MIYCVAFDCSANSSKNRVTCSWLKVPTEPTLFKKSKLQADGTQPSLLASRKLVLLRPGPEKMAALAYPGANISLKEDIVPTLFLVVEATLMPSIGIGDLYMEVRVMF